MKAHSFAVALLVAGGAWAQPLEEDVAAEREEVQERLDVERAALATLKDQQSSVLEVIDLIERRAHQTEVRAGLIERELAALRGRRALAERQEEAARSVMQEQLEMLRPRLRAMYQLKRKSRLDVLLTATDFASLVWRLRAMSTLLERDVALLKETHRAMRLQQEATRALQRLHESVAARGRLLAQERALSLEQQELLQQVLKRVAVDTKEQGRLVRELEQADRRLARMVDEFDSDVDDSEFASLRGSLIWPVAGIIEVGFGKVVNPRFNTVTFHKGLDIRARSGQPVLAVAPGRVVYADWLKGYGNLLIIDHGGGFHTLMGHLSSFSVDVGDEVGAGDEVAQVGDTASMKGSFLYFELRKNGIAIDPGDWLGPSGL